MRSYISAIDYKTGKTFWKQVYATPGGGLASGMLTTAGQLLFAGDTGNIIGYDAANGKPLWHAYLGGNVTNPHQTYALDGHQYMLTAAGETLFAFRPE